MVKSGLILYLLIECMTNFSLKASNYYLEKAYFDQLLNYNLGLD